MNMCAPSVNPVYAFGLVHDSHNPASSLQSKSAGVSLEASTKDAPAPEIVGVTVVFGARVSRTKSLTTGGVDALFEVSKAMRLTVQIPSLSTPSAKHVVFGVGPTGTVTMGLLTLPFETHARYPPRSV